MENKETTSTNEDTLKQEAPKKLKKGNAFWFNGKLISREEHDKLSWEEVHEWNNKVG